MRSQIKRVRYNGTREKKKEELGSITDKFKVLKAIEALDEIDREFNSKPRNFYKFGIERSKNKNFKILLKVYEYLIELRGGNGNSIEFLLLDYFRSVYQYYSVFNRLPYMNQLSPSLDNQMRHREFIYQSEVESDEDYWRSSSQSYDEIFFNAKKALDTTLEIERGFKVESFNCNIGVI